VCEGCRLWTCVLIDCRTKTGTTTTVPRRARFKELRPLLLCIHEPPKTEVQSLRPEESILQLQRGSPALTFPETQFEANVYRPNPKSLPVGRSEPEANLENTSPGRMICVVWTNFTFGSCHKASRFFPVDSFEDPAVLRQLGEVFYIVVRLHISIHLRRRTIRGTDGHSERRWS
jgi:hypothetical protein